MAVLSLSFLVPFYREIGLYHWVVGVFARGIRNRKDKPEQNSSGFSESLNRFTCSSGLQFNKYKYSSWLGTGLSANLPRGVNVEFRPWSMSRKQHQAGLSVSVPVMQLYWSCPCFCLTTLSLEMSLYSVKKMYRVKKMSSRDVVKLRLFQEKKYFPIDYAFTSAFVA